MKNILKFRIFFVLLILCFFSIKNINAQDEFSVFINSNNEDGNKIIRAYAGPMMNAIGNNFNNGWYSTADPLNKWRFDVRFIGTFSFAPDKYKTFNINDLELDYITSNRENLPTIFGVEDEAARFFVRVDDPNNPGEFQYLYSQKVPTIGISGFPGVTPQFNLGLPKGTEIMLRVLPPLKMSTDEIKSITGKVFGIGIKHNIKQWIPVIKHLPFSLSLIGTYSSVNLNLEGPFLDENDLLSNFSGEEQQEINDNPGTVIADYETQNFEFDVNSWNLSMLISKKFPIITFFGGVGITHSATKLSLLGNYPFIIYDESLKKLINNSTDPINVEVNKNQFGLSGGFRLKFGFLSLTGSGIYSPDGFSSLTVALGFGFFN